MDVLIAKLGATGDVVWTTTLLRSLRLETPRLRWEYAWIEALFSFETCQTSLFVYATTHGRSGQILGQGLISHGRSKRCQPDRRLWFEVGCLNWFA